MIDGKPMVEWTETQGWIRIGGWLCDPKTLSLKSINETVAWEIKNAKYEAMEEVLELWVKNEGGSAKEEVERLKEKYKMVSVLPQETNN